jgi:hypothetical protein
MRFLNSILIEGILLDQPSSIQSPDGIPRCSFSSPPMTKDFSSPPSPTAARPALPGDSQEGRYRPSHRPHRPRP